MNDRLRLVLLSFLMLFVELALIRWIGSNVVYLSYFSNFVLMGSFLGIGIGFLRAKSPFDLFPYGSVLLAFSIGFVLLFPVSVDRSGSQLIFFGTSKVEGLPIWVVLPLLFIAIAVIMAAIAQEVARTFSRFEPLEGYRLDILGSLTGIVTFSLLAFAGAPPVVWGLIAAVLFLMLQRTPIRIVQVVAAIAIVAALGKESLTPNLHWSPYYKVAVVKRSPQWTSIDVNGVPHQFIVSKRIARTGPTLYEHPYARLRGNQLDRVLIVGAGNGIDTAFALEHGAKHVDAVEIDPLIYRLGATLNPDRPYEDSRVSIHVDDGRAFLQRTHETYDLILFALPDSLTLVSGQSSLRLESYLFTVEAMRAARAHLRPGGAFAMYNYYREQWLVDRLARTLQEVYGHAPCVEAEPQYAHFALLTIGLSPDNVSCDSAWSAAGAPAPVHDDGPFPYLQPGTIPMLYLVTLALIVLTSIVAIRLSAGPLSQMRPYADLFFMGGAFLLLETKNVVQFALLFGSTWLVNALVFAGILLAVLAAVEVARRVRLSNPGLLYAALFLSLASAWIVDPAQLLTLDVPLRLAAAVALAFTPVFLANLVFADRFRGVSSSTIAFAANLLGAMLGGVLEYGALLVGYRNLLVVIAVLYALAFAFRPKAEPVITS